VEKSRGSGLLETPALFMPSEFPRIAFAGNSSHCKTRGKRGAGLPPWLSLLMLGLIFALRTLASVLLPLELAAVCNVSRILMQIAANSGRASSRESPKNPRCRQLRE